MPIYEFMCENCNLKFERLEKPDALAPACPGCGSTATHRLPSCPSPLKTGAFPFKAGPVHPLANRMGSPCGGNCPGNNG